MHWKREVDGCKVFRLDGRQLALDSREATKPFPRRRSPNTDGSQDLIRWSDLPHSHCLQR